MKRIKLDELKDKIYLPAQRKDTVIGYTTYSKTDINGEKQTFLNEEEEYIKVMSIDDLDVFFNRDRLLDMVLSKYTKVIDNGELYESGYPEPRVTPQQHYEDCEEAWMEEVLEEITGKLESYIDKEGIRRD